MDFGELAIARAEERSVELHKEQSRFEMGLLEEHGRLYYFVLVRVHSSLLCWGIVAGRRTHVAETEGNHSTGHSEGRSALFENSLALTSNGVRAQG